MHARMHAMKLGLFFSGLGTQTTRARCMHVHAHWGLPHVADGIIGSLLFGLVAGKRFYSKAIGFLSI